MPGFNLTRSGALAILEGVRQRWPWLQHHFADDSYDRPKLNTAALPDFEIEIVGRHRTKGGAAVIPRSGVVERGIGWVVRWRRLVRGAEKRRDVSEA